MAKTSRATIGQAEDTGKEECLHCVIVEAVEAAFTSRGLKPTKGETLAALMVAAGDLVGGAPADCRVGIARSAVNIMWERAQRDPQAGGQVH